MLKIKRSLLTITTYIYLKRTRMGVPSITTVTSNFHASPRAMLYSKSKLACGSSLRGLNSTARSSLTAKTVSLFKYSQSLSKICVTSCLYPLQRTWKAENNKEWNYSRINRYNIITSVTQIALTIFSVITLLKATNIFLKTNWSFGSTQPTMTIWWTHWVRTMFWETKFFVRLCCVLPWKRILFRVE